jgi:hypothetical protein
MDASISRAVVAATGFGTVSVYGDRGGPRLPLPTYRGGLLLGGFPRVQNSIRRAVERLAAPLSLARTTVSRTAVSNQLPGITSATGMSQSTEIVPAGWSRATNAGESAEILPRSQALIPMIMPMRSATMAAPAVLRRSHAFANQGQYASSPARGTLHDMPFVALSTIAREGGLTVAHRTNGTSIQTAPQGLLPSVTRAVPIGGGVETGVVETPTAASKPQIDLDELVEKAWQKLMRKLTIEQERRGYSRWA